MTVNAYSLIILIAAVHGLVLSFLLLVSKRNRRASNVLLALVLIFYTLPLLRVVLSDLNFFRSYELWFLSVELLYGLGPSIYLYCKTATDPEYSIGKADLIHFVPVVIEIIYYYSPLFQTPSNYTFSSVQSTLHLIWMVQQVGAILSVLVYLWLSNRLLWRHRCWVDQNFSQRKERGLRWLSNPIILYTIFFVFWFSLRLIDVIYFREGLAIQFYYPLLIFLSISTYWIGTKGYLEDQIDVFGFSQQNVYQGENETWGDTILNSVYHDLEAAMKCKKVYLDSDLSLSALANDLAINQRLLSKVINSKAKMNFYDYINQYRISEFKIRVRSDMQNKTLITLAYESGFGSKATFNHAFKKMMGMTPSQFKKQYRSHLVK